MKSTIKIDLGESNMPVINVRAILTDDVRDKLVRQFVERLGYDSNLALIKFTDSGGTGISGESFTDFSISPISNSEDFFGPICPAQMAHIARILPLKIEDNLQQGRNSSPYGNIKEVGGIFVCYCRIKNITHVVMYSDGKIIRFENEISKWSSPEYERGDLEKMNTRELADKIISILDTTSSAT